MPDRQAPPTVGETLSKKGVSRRRFLKFCTATAAMMGMPPIVGEAWAETLTKKRRPSVLYMPFQECTGCFESLTRAASPSIEKLLFDVISLDYNHTIMAAAGHQAEQAIENAIEQNWGDYLVIVDGSIPMADGGVYHTSGGKSAVDELRHVAEGAAAIVSVGTCAAFGGIPHADPNPTGAVAVSDAVAGKPVINVPGCPPIPGVMTGTLVYYYSQGQLPELDHLGRPRVFFGQTIHDRCYRRPFYDAGLFAKSFDDEGARNGWCLYELGCKGPTTYNACATMKWNDGTSFPIESGHPCLGCSEPNFWDNGSFYQAQANAIFGRDGQMNTRELGGIAGGAVAAGAVVGGAAATWSRHRQKARQSEAAGGEEE